MTTRVTHREYLGTYRCQVCAQVQVPAQMRELGLERRVSPGKHVSRWRL